MCILPLGREWEGRGLLASAPFQLPTTPNTAQPVFHLQGRHVNALGPTLGLRGREIPGTPGPCLVPALCVEARHGGSCLESGPSRVILNLDLKFRTSLSYITRPSHKERDNNFKKGGVGWKDGSVVKNPCCSCRGHEFSS